MKKWPIAAIGVASLSVAACGGAADGGEVASNIVRASLVGADNAQYGEVIVAEGDGGLIVNIDAEGMQPGQHGVHIHSIGKCEGPDFKSAGSHWNPEEKAHGFDNPDGAHMGLSLIHI